MSQKQKLPQYAKQNTTTLQHVMCVCLCTCVCVFVSVYTQLLSGAVNMCIGHIRCENKFRILNNQTPINRETITKDNNKATEKISVKNRQEDNQNTPLSNDNKPK